MKDWIQDRYNDSLHSYLALRTAILEAWNAVPKNYFEELLQQMPARYQAVIDANGMHIRY